MADVDMLDPDDARDDSLVLDVERIYSLPQGCRTEVIDDFLCAYASRIASIAGRLARQFHVGAAARDDVLQVVRTVAWQVLAGPRDHKVAANRVFTIISSRSRNEMTRFVQSSAWTGISGMVNAQRRYSAVSQHARRMSAVLGYDPSDEEVVASYNERVLSTRANAARQGALATMDDLRLPTLVHDPDHVLTDRSGHDDGTLDQAEGMWLVREVIDRCCADGDFGDELGMVAEAALGGHLSMAGDFTLSVVDLCESTGLSRGVVQRMVQRLRAVAVEVLDEMGLAG